MTPFRMVFSYPGGTGPGTRKALPAARRPLVCHAMVYPPLPRAAPCSDPRVGSRISTGALSYYKGPAGRFVREK
jgi:hypothetical protein